MRPIDADAIKIPRTHEDIFQNCRNCMLLDEGQVREIIDNVPTIGGWIPCSEQEPEEDGYYLVCWSDGQIETEWYDNEGWGYCDVVAWMPLPKPYRG